MLKRPDQGPDETAEIKAAKTGALSPAAAATAERPSAHKGAKLSVKKGGRKK